MSQALRAKFRVTEVTKYSDTLEQVKLTAAYSGDKNHEDNQFSQATPSGDMTMMISNVNAMGFFKPGKGYYLDIQQAED